MKSRGFLPARFEPQLVNTKLEWPAFITLRLGGNPLTLNVATESRIGRYAASAVAIAC